MDYGSCLLATIEAGDRRSNVAYKGIAVRLDPGQGGVSRGRAWVVYEHDTLRLAAAWTGQGFIDWNSINFNGQHQVHPKVVGRIHVANPDGPGWADPEIPAATIGASSAATAGHYGPMPRELGALSRPLPPRRPRGPRLHRRRRRTSSRCRASRLTPRSPASRSSRGPWRSAPRPSGWRCGSASPKVSVSLAGDRSGASLSRRDGAIVLNVPPAGSSRVVKVLMSGGDPRGARGVCGEFARAEPPSSFTHGGPKRWPEVLTTQPVIGRDDGPFAVDVLTLPDSNPWLCQMRPRASTSSPTARAPRSAPGTATSGSSAGSTDPRRA